MTASTLTSNQVRNSLETSYKSTRLQLSRILAFKAHLHQHGAAQYGQVTQTMVTTLKSEMDKFDGICTDLEKRVRNAIATLERDAKKASNSLQGTTQTDAVLPAAEPASSALPESITAASQAIAQDASMPVDPSSTSSAPPATESMQIDLTLSPSPPPAPEPVTTDPVPFALPTSTGDASSTSVAPSTSSGPPADDLNALLSSLNMPPFDPNAFLASQSSAGGSGATTTGMDADTLAALLGTGAATVPAGGTLTSAGTNLGASATGGQDVNLTGFDFSSITGLNTSTATAAANPSTSTSTSTTTTTASVPASPPASTNASTSGMDFDFSSLGAAGMSGLDGVDFSSISGSAGNDFDLSGLAMPAAGGEQMSEEQLQELLKSLGG
ncbi:hypothetical protein JCM3766R1_000631 [Sporobolomyces carnicolor]